MSSVCNKKTVTRTRGTSTDRTRTNTQKHFIFAGEEPKSMVLPAGIRNIPPYKGSPGCWEVTGSDGRIRAFPYCDREEAFDQINASMTTCPIDGRQIPVGREHVPQLVKYLKFQHPETFDELKKEAKGYIKTLYVYPNGYFLKRRFIHRKFPGKSFASKEELDAAFKPKKVVRTPQPKRKIEIPPAPVKANPFQALIQDDSESSPVIQKLEFEEEKVAVQDEQVLLKEEELDDFVPVKNKKSKSSKKSKKSGKKPVQEKPLQEEVVQEVSVQEKPLQEEAVQEVSVQEKPVELSWREKCLLEEKKRQAALAEKQRLEKEEEEKRLQLEKEEEEKRKQEEEDMLRQKEEKELQEIEERNKRFNAQFEGLVALPSKKDKPLEPLVEKKSSKKSSKKKKGISLQEFLAKQD